MATIRRKITLCCRGFRSRRVLCEYVRYLGTVTYPGGNGRANEMRELWRAVRSGAEFELLQEDDAREARQTRQVYVDAETARAAGMRPTVTL
jgi:hypothetical protein